MTQRSVDQTSHIFVALSGGVDSAVSAALLQQQGYRVTGAFIKTWQPPFLECRWPEDRDDARKVAAALDIPFTTVDLSDEYKREVVDYMIEEYRFGRTPNPDVICNMRIKFGGFLDEAQKRGADMIATGHYARIMTKTTRNDTKRHENPNVVQDGKKQQEQYVLLEGMDKEKDQSYFLWTLTQEQLSRSLFPAGEYQKSRIRELAHEFGLPVADKKDSQGVCFLGKLDMKEFLSHYIESEPGDVVRPDGTVIGRHDGALFFTLGQRRGFEVTDKSPDDGPHYVIDKDVGANTITVAPHKANEQMYRVNSIHLTDTNWVAERPDPGMVYGVRFRYRQPKQEATVTLHKDNSATVTFSEPQQAVTPGQSLVVYEREECLGGGVIQSITN